MLSEKQKEALRLLEFDEHITDVLYGGAAGGGKSYFGCHWQILRRLFNPKTRGCIGRDSLVNIKATTLETFFEVWNKYYTNNPMGVTIRLDGQKNIIMFSNGSFIYLKGLAYNSSDPEFTNLGSLEITDAFIDECNGCSKKGVDILSSRIRYKLIRNKSPMLLTANPGYDWVRERFWKNKDGVKVTLKPHEAFVFAKLDDNPSEQFRISYRKQLEKQSPYDRQRLLEGDWDAIKKANNPFLYAWSEERHVSSEAVYNPNLPIILSLDFNVNPLCGLWVQYYGSTAKIIAELSIENGNIGKLCDQIADRLKGWDVPISRLEITGDRNGSVQKIGMWDNKSNYLQIKEKLGLRESQFKLPANPLHNNSRSDCNKVLQDKTILVNPSCTGFIMDALLVECDSDGHILKKNRDKSEQRADHLDSFRYFVNTYFKR